jgi:hypothetical protein
MGVSLILDFALGASPVAVGGLIGPIRRIRPIGPIFSRRRRLPV